MSTTPKKEKKSETEATHKQLQRFSWQKGQWPYALIPAFEQVHYPKVGYFKNGNSRFSPTSHFSDAMWEMGCGHSQSQLPFTSQVGCGKI